MAKLLEIRPGRKIFVNHVDNGADETLFFIHGGGGHQGQWANQINFFKKDVNIVVFDLLGHGRSAKPKPEYLQQLYSFQENALDMQSLFERFATRRNVVIGHSYGAAIAVDLAYFNKRQINKLILIAPIRCQPNNHISRFFSLPLWGMSLLKPLFLSKFTRLAFNNRKNIDLLKKNPRRKLQPMYVLKSLVLGTANIPKLDVTHISQPTLLITASEDKITPTNRAYDFYKGIPDLTHVDLANTGHMIMQENPKVLNQEINNFLRRLNIKKFRNLVFEGSGMKGVAYCGAFIELEKMGVADGIKRVAGTSAGAIAALYIALGYKAKEMEKHLLETNYMSFADTSWGGAIVNSHRFITDYGWHKGDVLEDWFREIIEIKFETKTLTFAELKAKGGRDLYLVGTNLTLQCAEVYSFETTPDMDIATAMRITTSIPMYFKAMRREVNGEEHVVVDGGISWNYPVNIFDNEKYLDNPKNGEKVDYNKTKGYIFNHETLGCRLDPRDMQSLNKHTPIDEPVHIKNMMDYGKAIGKFITNITSRRHVHRNDWDRTVYIDSLQVASIDFHIDKKQIKVLMNEGKKGARKHFEWRVLKGPSLPF